MLNENSDEREENGRVSGNKDCGLMTVEEWMNIVVQDCSTEKDLSTAGRNWLYDKIVLNQSAGVSRVGYSEGRDILDRINQEWSLLREEKL